VIASFILFHGKNVLACNPFPIYFMYKCYWINSRGIRYISCCTHELVWIGMDFIIIVNGGLFVI
jgi:hypothetical protein